MAQKILLRRGGLASVNSGATISVTQGEQLFGSGSLANTTISDVVFVATGTGNGQFTSVGKIYSGTAAANSFNSKLDGLPYYKTDEQALYKLGDASALDLSGNLEGTVISSIEASGSFNGTFAGDGSALTNLNLGSISAPGNTTELLYNNAGALAATSDIKIVDGDLVASNAISGSDLYLSGNANIDGNIVIGGNITIGDASTDTVSFGGEISSDIIPSANNTYDLGSSTDKFAEVHATALYGNLTGDVTGDLTGDVTGQVSDISNHDTDALSEGSTNLYYTDARVKSKLNTEGVISGSAQISLGGDLSGTANSATVAKVQGVALTSGEATQIANIGTTTISGTQWGYLGALDQALGTANNVTFTDLSLDGDLAIATNKFTVNSVTGATSIAGALTVSADIDANDVTIDDWGSVSASLASLENNAAGAGLQEVTDINAATTNDITVRNIKIGVDAADEISTSTGNLILDSAAGTVQVDDNLTVTGNLVVQGTTTTVDSTTIQLGDNIIELNGSGAANGGLLVTDVTAPNLASGSLLWDSTNDYWKGGALGSEKEFARFNTDPTSNAVAKVNASGLLVDSNISDDGSAVTISTGLTAAGLTDSTSAAAIRFSYINASKKHSYVTPAATGDVLQWNGSAMVSSNVIDGGSF